MPLRILTILLLIFLWQFVPAKEKGHHYLPIGIGWSYQHAKDDGMSPLLYKGNSGAVLLGYSKWKEKAVHQFDIVFNYGTLHTRNYKKTDNAKTYAYRADLRYILLRKVKQFKGYRIYAGGSFSLLGNMRVNYKLGNSAANYEFFTSLGLTSGISKTFSIRQREIIIDFKFDLPFLTFGMRPNYVNLTDFTDPEYKLVKDHFQRGTWMTFNDYTRGTLLLDFSYPLKNGNIIRLGYHWDFYSYRKLNKVKASLEGLMLSTVFNF